MDPLFFPVFQRINIIVCSMEKQETKIFQGVQTFQGVGVLALLIPMDANSTCDFPGEGEGVGPCLGAVNAVKNFGIPLLHVEAPMIGNKT